MAIAYLTFAKDRGLWHWHSVRYCQECWTEFVATVQRCSDCGGPLQDGELPAARPRDEEIEDGEVVTSDLADIDSLITELPGEEAEHFAEALRMEGVHSRLECGEIVRHRGPGQKATAKISFSLPVQIFVADAERERARDILESINQEDLIGDAWSEGAEAEEIYERESLLQADAELDQTAPPEIRTEGISSRAILVLLLAVAVGLIFVLAR